MFCNQPSKDKLFLASRHRKQDVLFQCEFLISYLNKITKTCDQWGKQWLQWYDCTKLQNWGKGQRWRERDYIFNCGPEYNNLNYKSGNRIVSFQPPVCNARIQSLFGGPYTFLFLLSSTLPFLFFFSFPLLYSLLRPKMSKLCGQQLFSFLALLLRKCSQSPKGTCLLWAVPP